MIRQSSEHAQKQQNDREACMVKTWLLAAVVNKSSSYGLPEYGLLLVTLSTYKEHNMVSEVGLEE